MSQRNLMTVCLKRNCRRDRISVEYPADFMARAEAILPATERSSTFVCCGRQQDHRIELWLDDGRPDTLTIKLDLRKPDMDLFGRIVDYAAYLDTLIVPDERFAVVPPNLTDLAADLVRSRAYLFCEDPRGYLTQFAARIGKARQVPEG